MISRFFFTSTALLALLALVACESDQQQRRSRRGGNRFGYQGTETQTVVEQQTPVAPEPTETTTSVEPAPPPPPVRTEKSNSGTQPARKDYPYGTPVPGKQGFVTSPHAPYSGYVDVRGFPPGTEVKDPYTGKIFLVP